MSNEHSKVINKVAKKLLKPQGIVQKGQSRIWLDDHGWFTTIIEFQPRDKAKGSFLNIAAHFHWHKKDCFSFDLGYRELDFVEYKNDEQFAKKMEKFCELTIEKVLEIRKKLATLHSAKKVILGHTFVSEEIWGKYHKGTICGLTGDIEKLNKHYGDLLKYEHRCNAPFIDELKENTKFIQSKASNLELFKAEILSIIAETRKLKKLPEMEIML